MELNNDTLSIKLGIADSSCSDAEENEFTAVGDHG